MDRKPVDSSNIRSVGWENGVLEVEFKNYSIYHYYGVDKETFQQLIAAESVGKYLGTHVKGVFPYARVD